MLPDIVVLGKPIGNGHPLGVLVTTRAIAESFTEGPEFFSTFGGSTLSCRIGKEVLDIVDDEDLQDNARRMGAELMQGLKALERDHACVGDVRGMGLFLGVELIRADGSEATDICAYVKQPHARPPHPHRQRGPQGQHPQDPPAIDHRPGGRRHAAERVR